MVSDNRITYEILVGLKDLDKLLMLSPHMFRSTPERQQKALSHDELSLTVGVITEELTATIA